MLLFGRFNTLGVYPDKGRAISFWQKKPKRMSLPSLTPYKNNNILFIKFLHKNNNRTQVVSIISFAKPRNGLQLQLAIQILF
jgi:hypothetical protein